MLVRDPFGIKQLYVAETDAVLRLRLGAGALIAAGLAGRGLRARAARRARQLKFTTGRETIFADIHRLLPGERLEFADGAWSSAAPPRGAARRRPGPGDDEALTADAGRGADRHGRPPSALRRALRPLSLRRDRLLGAGGADGAAHDQPVYAMTAGFSGQRRRGRDRARRARSPGRSARIIT